MKCSYWIFLAFMELLFPPQGNWCLPFRSALDYVTASSSLAENKGAYCIARLFGGWGLGVVPSGPLKMSYVFLKSCFVYFLSFRVKVLNINGFAQRQRMRIDNTEGVTQKRNHHTVLIIPSVTKKCLFLPLSLPHLPLADKLILAV